MNENYTEVPNMISGKDLDYLSDMFLWNYEALKKASNASENVEDSELKDIIDRAATLFDSNLNVVLNILEGGQPNE